MLRNNESDFQKFVLKFTTERTLDKLHILYNWWGIILSAYQAQPQENEYLILFSVHHANSLTIIHLAFNVKLFILS